MAGHKEIYKQRLSSVDAVLGEIRSGDVIVCGGSSLEPQALLWRLHELRGRVENITVMVALGVTPYPFMVNEEYADTFRVPVNFMQSAARTAHKLGIAEFVPSDLDDGYMHWTREHQPDWCFIQASPPDDRGNISISLSLLKEMECVETAKKLVVEINPHVPFVYGDGVIPLERADFIIEADNPLPVVPSAPAGATEKQIAENIASLICDGDTLQLGIGSIPDSVAELLMDRHDLGIHTEMLTNSMRDLIEAGAVTNARKTLDTGLTVACFAMGLPELYAMTERNPKLSMRRGHYCNDPRVIARQENFVSVNNALCVDLGGQVCSESIGPRMYSGTGGQFNTAYGAFHAPNGRGIIALRSTANTKNGRISTINSLLPMGSVVSLSRNYVDYIVTEYGIAHLRGCSVRERSERLIAVAHPDFRAELAADARKFALW